MCIAVIVTGMLVLGGAAFVNALSGMDIYAASFLIPLVAAPFTLQGLIRDTVLRDCQMIVWTILYNSI
jgi:urea-proton symporter